MNAIVTVVGRDRVGIIAATATGWPSITLFADHPPAHQAMAVDVGGHRQLWGRRSPGRPWRGDCIQREGVPLQRDAAYHLFRENARPVPEPGRRRLILWRTLYESKRYPLYHRDDRSAAPGYPHHHHGDIPPELLRPGCGEARGGSRQDRRYEVVRTGEGHRKNSDRSLQAHLRYPDGLGGRGLGDGASCALRPGAGPGSQDLRCHFYRPGQLPPWCKGDDSSG